MDNITHYRAAPYVSRLLHRRLSSSAKSPQKSRHGTRTYQRARDSAQWPPRRPRFPPSSGRRRPRPSPRPPSLSAAALLRLVCTLSSPPCASLPSQLWRGRRVPLRQPARLSWRGCHQSSTTRWCANISFSRRTVLIQEWQSRQRKRTKEWHAYRQKEEAEEEIKANEYREIGMRLKAYPQEEVRKARVLVSSFIRAGEDVEKEIEKAAERGELTELLLMVIWNRLDVARHDDEKDAIRSLDLLYRRVETEILRSEASPAMRLLNELLNMHDGVDDDKWLKTCRKRMIDVFPREDPFTMVFPAGFDMEKHQGQIKLPPEDDDVLLRVDFVREVDELLKEVQAEQEKNKLQTGYDPESVATMLKQQEKLRTIRQVEALSELAATLKW